MSCKTAASHCENCGSTNDLDGDQGYTACCNELVTDGRSCNGGHEHEAEAQRKIDAEMAKRGFTGHDGRDLFIDQHGLEAFDAIVQPIFDAAWAAQQRGYAR
jgi:hypothetical protein